MVPHTDTESTVGTTSFLAICTKTKLTTGAFCLFYKPGLCVVLAAKYAQLRMLFLMSLTFVKLRLSITSRQYALYCHSHAAHRYRGLLRRLMQRLAEAGE